MLLFDSSGVNKDAALEEHREAIRSVLAAAKTAEADQLAVACALDWLLYDWLMAHRDGPDSAAIEIPKGREGEAVLIVDATAASVIAKGLRSSRRPSLSLIVSSAGFAAVLRNHRRAWATSLGDLPRRITFSGGSVRYAACSGSVRQVGEFAANTLSSGQQVWQPGSAHGVH
ncbi:MAG: hypothetical protein JWO67_1611 [Streptosporangiaceae bacterium]|jgi:hypothetical protein|nr:hypothetical protein [Streptosporangiaceae bacterium]